MLKQFKRSVVFAVLSAVGGLALTGASQAAAPAYVNFESGPVRPIAMSADKTRLFVANTPNSTLDVFSITASGLQLQSRVPVGLEPVAVAVAANGDVWVVNHVSDSVSIVSTSGTPHVVRTLLVGDEPRDIVFAGNPARAFVTTAHRGQQLTDASIASVPGAGDPKLTTGGVGRADVWVFNPASLGTSSGGTPLKIVNLFSDTPRALAVSPDRSTVYAAAFHSGNKTTSIMQSQVCAGFNPYLPCIRNGTLMPGGNHGPWSNADGRLAPETGLIVKYNDATKRWEDSMHRDWSNAVRFKLPDRDVFAINANTLTQTAAYSGVGTVLFNMVANPVNGNVYVSNTDANNLARFEGSGAFSGSTVQGNLAKARITVVSPAGVRPRHLNKHIDYTKLANSPGFDTTAKNHSLATPLEMVVSGDGSKLYVAAFGSSRIGVFNTAELESDSYDPRRASANYINVTGGGPSGLVLDESRGRMYVTTRFDNSVKVIDLASKAEVSKATMASPEPASVIEGRPFLYDAQRSSANGEASCSSCHTFGDMDQLAWDLGDPDGKVTTSPLTINLGGPVQIAAGKILLGVFTPINGSDIASDLHPMKGPMTTQTLRGMRNSGAMHWRGDRSTGTFGTSATDSTVSFKNFAGAFQGLLGNPAPMGEAEMQKFANFTLPMLMPPNPVRKLDNSLTAAQQRGKDFYGGYGGVRPSDGILFPVVNAVGVAFDLNGLVTSFTCEACHRLDPANGFFGTGGRASFEGEAQIVKIPQLRNVYQKVGMFGAPQSEPYQAPDSGNTGDQIRGFGFLHDGSTDTMLRFFSSRVFGPTLTAGFPLLNPDATRRDVIDLMLAFDSDVAPIVGQQVTLDRQNTAAVGARINLLIQRANANFVSKEFGGTTKECDLVVHMVNGGQATDGLYEPATASFLMRGGNRLTDSAIRAVAATDGQEVTYTCAPPGSGYRMAFSY